MCSIRLQVLARPRLFSADGSKAFEDLAEVVKGMPSVGLEQDWKHDVQESLKAAKLYFKGD